MNKIIFATILICGCLSHGKSSNKTEKLEEKRSPDFYKGEPKGIKPEFISSFNSTGYMSIVYQIYDSSNKTTCYILGTDAINCVKD